MALSKSLSCFYVHLFLQFGSEHVSGLGHEFVTVSPPLEDARLKAVGAVGDFAAGQLLKHVWDKVIQDVRIALT